MLHRSKLLALLLACATFASIALLPDAPAQARVGARPQAFDLPAVPGSSNGAFDLGDHLGRDPIAIVFWATWCDPCKQQLPLYQQLYERYREQGLKVVAISMDGPETVQHASADVRRLGLSFPVVSDVDTTVSSRLNPRRAAPFTIWIDRDGRIVYEREGFTLGERNSIARGISALVRRGASADSERD